MGRVSTCKQVEDGIFRFILRFRIWIILFWLVAAGVSCIWAMSLPNFALFQFLPPKGSNSYITYDLVLEYFPMYIYQDVEIIVISYKNNKKESIISPMTQQLCNVINQTLYDKVQPEIEYRIQTVTQLYQFNLTSETSVKTPASDTINEYIYNSAKESFVSSDETVMIVVIEANVHDLKQQDLNNMIAKLQSGIKHVSHIKISDKNDDTFGDYYDLTLTGALTIFDQALEAFTSDMTSNNIYVLPFILVFMVFVVCFCFVFCIYCVFVPIKPHGEFFWCLYFIFMFWCLVLFCFVHCLGCYVLYVFMFLYFDI